MYVRLVASWADASGAVHGAGEFVDVDVVTLAELEEQGVVENSGEEKQPESVGDGDEEVKAGFVGPTKQGTDFVGPTTVGTDFVGPTDTDTGTKADGQDE